MTDLCPKPLDSGPATDYNSLVMTSTQKTATAGGMSPMARIYELTKDWDFSKIKRGSTATRICGHQVTFGRFGSRGQNRIASIQAALKPCAKCRHAALRSRSATLTRSDGTPYTAVEIDAYLAGHAAGAR